MTTCITWKQPDAKHFHGMCTNRFRLTTPPAGVTFDAGCDICVNPLEETGVATLRAFDIATGGYLWQVLNFYAAGTSPDAAVWGYKWRNDTTGMKVNQAGSFYVNTVASGTAGAGFWNSQSKFQTKTSGTGEPGGQRVYVADFYKISPSGIPTLIMSDVDRYATPTGEPPNSVPDRGFALLNLNQRSQSAFIMSNAGLHIGKAGQGGANQVGIFATDSQYKAPHHFLRIFPAGVYPINGTPRWVMRSGTQEVRFSLHADAAEVKAAFLSFPFITNATVTGGPALYQRMDIELEYATPTDKIDYMIIEFATTTYTNGFIGSSWTGMPQVWDALTHTPVVVFGDQRISPFGGAAIGFAETGDGILATGPYGPSGRSGVGKLIWTTPAGPPNYATINSLAWAAAPFDQMTSTQEDDGDGPVPISRGISAIKNGKIAVTSTACRLTNSGGGFFTTILLDAATGAQLAIGYSGFQAGTNLAFKPDGSYYINGTNQRYADPGSSHVTGQSLDIGAHWYPGMIEASTSDVNSHSACHEADFMDSGLNGPGLGILLVKKYQAQGQPAIDVGSRAFDSFATNNQTMPHYIQRGMWVGGTVAAVADTTYPYASYYRDYLTVLSLLMRLSESTEWRFLHGVTSSGVFTAHKTTKWFTYFESLASIQAELDLWYGNVVGGGRIVTVNPFGPPSTSESPAWPSWYMASQLYILRARGAPNATSPIAPAAYTTFKFEWKNNTFKLPRTISGTSYNNGIVQWTRDVGQRPGDGANALGNIIASDGSKVIVSTSCDPTIVPPIYGRGQ